MSNSPFQKVMSGKTDAELRSIIEDAEGYRLEAREAAIFELEKREGRSNGESARFQEQKDQLSQERERDKERKRRKERFFYIPKDAPTIVKFIGLGYYILLGIVIIQFITGLVITAQFSSLNFWSLFFPILIFTIQAFIIDGILKGNKWARAINMILCVLGLLIQIGVFSIMVNNRFMPSGSDAFGLIQSLVYITAAILLYVDPAKQWFNKGVKVQRKHKDLLDDF